VGILVGTVPLAWLTTRYVEDPIRHHRRARSSRPGAVLLVTGAVALLMVAPSLTGVRIATANAERAARVADALVASQPRCFGAASMDRTRPCHNPALDHQVVPAPTAASKVSIDYPGCFDDYEDVAILDCRFGDTSDERLPHVLLVGDSHAQMFLPTLVALAEKGLLTVQAQLKAACPWASPPASRHTHSYPEECTTFRNRLTPWLRAHAKDFDLVLTTSRMDDVPGTPAQQRRDFAAAWNVVGRQGVPVVGIVDNPLRPHDPNGCLAQLDPDEITPRSCGVRRSELPEVVDPTRGAAALTENGHVLDLTDLYCHEDWCPAVAGGVNIYRDYSHLTGTYAETLGPYLYRRLVDRGLLRVL
jgi:hypothetical protein